MPASHKTKRKQGRSTHTHEEREARPGQQEGRLHELFRLPSAFSSSALGAFSRASKFSRNEKPAGGPTEDNSFDAPAERGAEAPRPLHPDINTKQDTRRRVRDMKKKRQARQDRKIVREHTKIRLIPGSCLPPPPSLPVCLAPAPFPFLPPSLQDETQRGGTTAALRPPPPRPPATALSIHTHEGPSST